jgi:nitrogen fixation/metabolism regulation signal transduction histidine kinase
MAQINTNTQTTIALCLVALLVAILLGLITSSWITQTILHLSKASVAIAEGKLDARSNIKGIKELEVLSTSFNLMAKKLQDSFEQLERQVFELQQAKEAAEVANRVK